MTGSNDVSEFDKAARRHAKEFDRIAIWVKAVILLSVLASVSIIGAVVYFVIQWANSLGGTP